MAENSKIEWTDSTWNPVTGCTKVSAGCANCYAERDWARLAGNPNLRAYHGREFTDVQCHPERLDQPRRWRKPKRIFVNSMSDLFHPDVPDEFIAKVFTAMYASPDHTFQILTKRPDRMSLWLRRCENGGGLGWITHDGTEPARAYRGTGIIVGNTDRWPLPNVWLGVSVEDQKAADERIPLLLQTPAAVLFVSYEPALGPIDFDSWPKRCWLHTVGSDGSAERPGLDWIICGGESGPKARPMHPDWARKVRDDCKAAGVPFFFKQWGEWAPGKGVLPSQCERCFHRGYLHAVRINQMVPGPNGSVLMNRVGKRTAGALLDGREHKEFPK